MIVWLILAGIALIIAIILMLSVKVTFYYENDIFLKVKYAFITIYSIPSKPKKKKKPKKEKKAKKVKEKASSFKEQLEKKIEELTEDEKPQKTNSPENEEKAKKSSSDKPQKERIDFSAVKTIIDTAKPPIKRLFKKIRFYDLYINITSGGEDAAKVALNYGKTNMMVNTALSWLDHLVNLKINKIIINADFDKTKSEYIAGIKIKLRLSTILSCGIWLLYRYLKYIRRT